MAAQINVLRNCDKLNRFGMLNSTTGVHRFSFDVTRRLPYLQRIFAAYLTTKKSHLTFWREVPEINNHLQSDTLGEYYMTFLGKADYPGEYDEKGIPLLNYHGKIGLQYNPIAIAQYGLGNFNLYKRTKEANRLLNFLGAANWLITNLERNMRGLWVWNHNFNFEYYTLLKAPWYSALAQGNGISVLVRAHELTNRPCYLEAATRAFQSFKTGVDDGGVTFIDERGNIWFEEYIVDPPTHILNGFIWAMWGVYDYFLATGSVLAQQLFYQTTETLAENLSRYDTGFWSLYDQSKTRMKMLASEFYHKLHIVQLKILYKLTGQNTFRRYAEKWENYWQSSFKRKAAFFYKAIFKLFYY